MYCDILLNRKIPFLQRIFTKCIIFLPRMNLCNEAIALLEEETARDEVTNCSQDLLAIAYFYLGCFQHKSVVVKSRSTKQENKDSGRYEPGDSNGCSSKVRFCIKH